MDAYGQLVSCGCHNTLCFWLLPDLPSLAVCCIALWGLLCVIGKCQFHCGISTSLNIQVRTINAGLRCCYTLCQCKIDCRICNVIMKFLISSPWCFIGYSLCSNTFHSPCICAIFKTALLQQVFRQYGYFAFWIQCRCISTFIGIRYCSMYGIGSVSYDCRNFLTVPADGCGIFCSIIVFYRYFWWQCCCNICPIGNLNIIRVCDSIQSLCRSCSGIHILKYI